MSGSIYSARQLFDMGVVDMVTPEGTGEQAVYSYVRKHARNANARFGFERARNQVTPVSREELLRVADVWADTALGLSDRDLRMMERLVRAQHRSPDYRMPRESGSVIALSSARIAELR